MNRLLQVYIQPSSGLEPCDVLLGDRAPAVALWQGHLHGLATLIHELSGLALSRKQAL
jgi:hypothetical protein